MSTQNTILARVIELVQPVGQFLQSRKQRKKRAVSNADGDEPDTPGINPPEIIHHFQLGLNKVTKQLEDQLRRSPECLYNADNECVVTAWVVSESYTIS